MVDSNIFDNRFALTFKQAKVLLSDFFTTHLPHFSEGVSESYGMSFKIIYNSNNIEFVLESERGYLTYNLTIDNQPIDLGKFDEQVKNIEVFSKINILFLLKTLKNYLNSD